MGAIRFWYGRLPRMQKMLRSRRGDRYGRLTAKTGPSRGPSILNGVAKALSHSPAPVPMQTGTRHGTGAGQSGHDA